MEVSLFYLVKEEQEPFDLLKMLGNLGEYLGQAARGQGVGEALNREAIGRAQAEGATTVDLTSRPSREAANRLYRRLGFEKRTTNVSRLAL